MLLMGKVNLFTYCKNNAVNYSNQAGYEKVPLAGLSKLINLVPWLASIEFSKNR